LIAKVDDEKRINVWYNPIPVLFFTSPVTISDPTAVETIVTTWKNYKSVPQSFSGKTVFFIARPPEDEFWSLNPSQVVIMYKDDEKTLQLIRRVPSSTKLIVELQVVNTDINQALLKLSSIRNFITVASPRLPLILEDLIWIRIPPSELEFSNKCKIDMAIPAHNSEVCSAPFGGLYQIGMHWSLCPFKLIKVGNVNEDPVKLWFSDKLDSKRIDVITDNEPSCNNCRYKHSFAGMKHEEVVRYLKSIGMEKYIKLFNFMLSSGGEHSG